MLTTNSQVMRFSREDLEDGEECFSVHWIVHGSPLFQRSLHFPEVALFRAWLLTDQGYSEYEAEALIAQLRQHDGPRVGLA